MRLLVLGLVQVAAHPQSAGALARVSTDEIPVFRRMDAKEAPAGKLKKGDRVTIGLVFFGDEITWCAVTREGERRRTGYVSCEFLEPDRNPARPAETAPQPPGEPIRIREVPSQKPPDVRIREATPSETAAARQIEEAKTPPPASDSAKASGPPVEGPPAPATTTPGKQATPAAPAEPRPAQPEPKEIKPKRSAKSPAPPADVPAPAERPALDTRPTAVPSTTRAETVRAVETAKLEPPKPAVAEPAAPSPAVAPKEKAMAPPKNFGAEWLDRTGERSRLRRYVNTTPFLSFIDKGRLAEIDLSALEAIVEQNITGERLARAIESEYNSAYASSHGEALLRWWRSPLSGRVGRLFDEAGKDEAYARLVGFANRLKENPPDQSRLVLIHRLHDAQRTSEMQADATIALVRAIAQGLNPLLPQAKRFGGRELEDALKTVRERYLAVLRNANIVFDLFALQSCSDQEIEEDVKFWESPAGVWLMEARQRGFRRAEESMSRSLFSDIVAGAAKR